MSPALLRITSPILLCLMATNAHAYLDPGTGSMLIQGLIAAIAMIGITGKIYWHRLLVFFGKREPSVEDETETEQNPPDPS